jgi:diguanylate cyclase
MNDYLIPLTSACTLITLNYIAMKIRSKMLIESYEQFAAPIFTGLACIMMMLQPLPPQLGLVDLRSMPIFMAGLRYGFPIAMTSTIVPTLYSIGMGDTEWFMQSTLHLLIPAIVSSFFHKTEYRSGYTAIRIHYGLFICLIVFILQQLYHYFTEPVLNRNPITDPLYILLLAGATITLLIVMVNDENKTWMLQRQSELQANQDGLTGLPNMRSFLSIANNSIKRRKVSLFMIDIDNFKRFNDHFGHLEGDHLLRKIGSLLRNQIREEDYVARYGGEEFILMSTETDVQRLSQYAQHLCTSVANDSIQENGTQELPPITISVGISIALYPMDDLNRLIKEADEALYTSKFTGKNRYTFYKHEVAMQDALG